MNVLSYLPGTKAWRVRRDVALCQRAAEQIHEIVDGELRPGKATKTLERHLDACRSCHGEAEVIRALKQAIARVGCDADPEFVRRLEHFARQLCERSGPA
jgi:anti-sigma factor RsiW